MLLDGVGTVIEAVWSVNDDGVFLNIEARGNILVQVALTTCIKSCIDIELKSVMRCAHSVKRTFEHLKMYPLLRKVHMGPADVRDATSTSQPPTNSATVVFANIFFFEEDANLVVAREFNVMPKARVMIATSPFCTRYRSPCTQLCYGRWTLVQEVMVHCSWKSVLRPLYIYNSLA